MLTALFIATVLAQPPQAPPVTRPDQAPPVVDVEELLYVFAQRQAVAEGKPIARFIGINARKIDGCVVAKLSGYNDNKTPRIIVSRVDSLEGLWLPPDATDQQIRQMAGLEASQPATPFRDSSLRVGEVRIADVDLHAGGLPAFLRELVPYRTATMTQQTFRRWSGYIAPYPRANVLQKWIVPGGMEGVHGWNSRLLKNRHAVASVGLVRQDPADASSAITWGRTYPDGAVFADVLRNERGQVFEVRVAEKAGGQWERFVAYRDPGARPHGYVPVARRQCVECHAKAGTSEYADAAVPGGDTILSDPYDVLERGQSVQGGFGLRLN